MDLKHFTRDLTLALLMSSLLPGCGQSLENQLLQSASSQLVQKTTGYPAVVMVAMPGGYGMCTGTFVSPRAVLTASHCTDAEGYYRIYTDYGWFETSTKQNLGPGTVGDASDISLLLFDEDVADPAKGHVIAVGTQPSESSEVRLVGFGCNDLDKRVGAGVKRTGTNRIYRITQFIELLTTPANKLRARVLSGARVLGSENQAGSCFGDSGGPLLASQNGLFRTVGVTHAGGYQDSLILSQYTNLYRSENRAFLEEMDSRYGLHLFDGCWTSSEADACGPTSASFRFFAFLKPWLQQIFQWIWAF
jgi:hypothetical protein